MMKAMFPGGFTDVPYYVKDFLNYQTVIQGKSKNTVLEYHYDLRTFLKFLKMSLYAESVKDLTFEEISVIDVSLDDIKKVSLSILYEYLSFLNSVRGNDTSARARKISSLRAFFKYMTDKADLIKENPTLKLETPKLRKALPSYLTLEESKKLLSAVKDGEFKERDLCIITLFLNCGMRLSELIGINLKDIKEDTIRILGKGNKERTVYLNKSCQAALNNYLRVRPRDGVLDSDALFLSKRKRRISDSMVQTLIKKYIEAAGLDPAKYSPHKLRHTAATLMYTYADVDILVLQEILGHENLNTTKIYTHVDNKEAKEAAKKHPLA